MLYDCLDYIDTALSSGGRVLVHCSQGVSRSATLAIAYIMWRSRRPYEEVRARRSMLQQGSAGVQREAATSECASAGMQGQTVEEVSCSCRLTAGTFWWLVLGCHCTWNGLGAGGESVGCRRLPLSAMLACTCCLGHA